MSKLAFRTLPILLLLAICFPRLTVAQETPFRTIPIPGVLPHGELSPDGHTLAIFEDGIVHHNEIVDALLPLRLINIDDGTETLLTGHTGYAFSIAFSPDGTQLVSFHDNGELLLWDTASGRLLARWQAFLGGGWVKFLPDGQRLATMLTVENMNQIWLWDVNTKHVLQIFSPHYDRLSDYTDSDSIPDEWITFAFAPDNQTMAVASSYGHIWLWSLDTGQSELIHQSEETIPAIPVRSLSFAGDTLTYLNNREDILYIRSASGETTTIPLSEAANYTVAPDGKTLAWVIPSPSRDEGDGPAIVVWNLAQDGEPTTYSLEPFRVPSNPFKMLHFTPDGQQLVLVGLFEKDTAENQILIIDLGH